LVPFERLWKTLRERRVDQLLVVFLEDGQEVEGSK
jgi:hypothetical protein